MNIHHIILLISSIFISGCLKPNHHPKNPNYEIKKPEIKYDSIKKEHLKEMVSDLEGSPYVWAEEGPNNFDCSGYTYYLYGSMGLEIPRVAREQAKKGKKINVNELVYGDLIFFDTTKTKTGKITHVGMYLGNGWFTHASSKKHEVTYSKLSNKYYKNRLKVCRRYIPKGKKINQTVWKVENKVKFKEKKYVSESIKHKLVSSSGIYIQVGSYINYPNKTIINKTNKLNLKYEIITFPKDGLKVNKVLVGPYNNQNFEILNKIRLNISKGAFFVKID